MKGYLVVARDVLTGNAVSRVYSDMYDIDELEELICTYIGQEKEYVEVDLYRINSNTEEFKEYKRTRDYEKYIADAGLEAE